jgi:UDP-N-acetylmuramoyl-L-alanyl-D-glutamate--2,6-diaminopimelate ligase
MFLSHLLEGVIVTKLFSIQYGKMLPTQETQVSGICYDSREVRLGDLFVAIPGTALDGHRFIDNAIANGASVVVVQDDAARPDMFFVHAGVVKVVVPDTRKALARMAANYYGRPSHRLRLIGVTGTNGKTTTTHLIKSILEAGGETVGLIGTIEYRIGGEVIPATHTTPESLELNRLLARMVERGCTAAVMEVSSHSLALSRVEGLEFRAGVFTNLTQDHLDFHGTMEAYFGAKKLLFDDLPADASAVINADDSRGEEMVHDTRARRLSYGILTPANFRAQDVELSIAGTRFVITHDGMRTLVESQLTGRFNVSNLLAAYSTGVALGLPEEQIVRGISALKAVRGRFEQIASPAGWTAIVDYAHTPDALENCLRTIHEVMPGQGAGKIITVFGCGGNRDAGKRPVMGRIASELSDVVVVTSDNPRREDPKTIVDQITSGVLSGAELHREIRRREAIRLGLSLARRGDVVLIAGKGHETYQVVGETRSHFDDREEVEAFIRGAS